MRQGDGPANREPEPQSLGPSINLGVPLVEGIKDTVLDGVVNANARVDELDDQDLVPAGFAVWASAGLVTVDGEVAGTDRQCSVRGCEASRIAHQVPDDLRQSRMVAHDVMARGGEIEYDSDARGARRVAADFHGITDQPVDVDRLPIEHEATARDTRYV